MTTPRSAVAALLTILAVTPAAARAAAPASPIPAGPEHVDLFTAGKDGYALYRIPGIVVTGKGTVLAYCEARKSAAGDWGPIDIVMRRSTDGGKTFGPVITWPAAPGPHRKNPAAVAQKLAKADDPAVTNNNPVLIAGEGGTVHGLFCTEYERAWYVRSDDDGATWSAPADITKTFETFRPGYDWKIIATGPAHGIRLKGGRLVVAVWMSLGTGGHAHRPSVVATVYSDDAGKTWHPGDIAARNEGDLANPNETALAQLADGRVMLNIRSESKAHRRAVSTSPDGAKDWTRPAFDDGLREPICMASLLALPAGTLVFANPDTLDTADGKPGVPGRGRVRKNLALKLSDDGGRTWAASRVLEPGFAGYSDLAVLPDGTLLCFYETGSTDGRNIYRTGLLRVSRVSTDWIRAAK